MLCRAYAAESDELSGSAFLRARRKLTQSANTAVDLANFGRRLRMVNLTQVASDACNFVIATALAESRDFNLCDTHRLSNQIRPIHNYQQTS